MLAPQKPAHHETNPAIEVSKLSAYALGAKDHRDGPSKPPHEPCEYQLDALGSDRYSVMRGVSRPSTKMEVMHPVFAVVTRMEVLAVCKDPKDLRDVRLVRKACPQR